MPTLKNNLISAHCAIEYVKNSLPFGADNRPESTDEAKLRVRSSRLACNFVVLPIYQIIRLFSASAMDILSAHAYTSMFFRAGNCGEQAAIAFNYLKELGIGNLDYVYLFNNDHAFVVIGRDKGSDISDFRTWGKNAVVCDPWGGRYYPASDIVFQLNSILVEANFRRFNPIAQVICLECSYNNLSLRPIHTFASPTIIKQATQRYDAFKTLLTEQKQYQTMKDVAACVSHDTFDLGAFSTPFAVSSTLFRNRYRMARAVSPAFCAATVGLFAVSSAARKLVGYSKSQEEKVATKIHDVWR